MNTTNEHEKRVPTLNREKHHAQICYPNLEAQNIDITVVVTA